MAAPFAYSRADVEIKGEGTGESLKGVSVIVRGGRATIRRGRDLLRDVAVVTDSQLSTRSWSVVTATEVWEVVKAQGCGCGGR